MHINLSRTIVAVIAVLVAVCGASAPRAATFTVISTRNAGNGSLRWAIASANGAPGSTVAFAIPTSDVRYNAVTGVFRMRIQTPLPPITAAGTVIDGTTQAANVGNTNPALLGSAGVAGVDGLPLPLIDGPEIELRDRPGLAIGLDIQAGDVVVRGLAVIGYGNAGNSNDHANIRIGPGGTGALVERCVIGAGADSFSDPGIARSGGDNVRVVGASFGTLRGNLIGFSQGKGIGLVAGSTGWTLEGNEIRDNGIGTANLDAIDIENGSGGALVRGNLLARSAAVGLDSYQGSGGNRIENNTITDNGLGAGAGLELAGVRLYGTGNVVDRNVIRDNAGAGIVVTSASTGNTITRNSISGNGPLLGSPGIDLLGVTDDRNQGSPPYVTLNDVGDADSGGNSLVNFPVIGTALVSGTNLSLSGFARPGSVIELFLAAPDGSGFGEGLTYLATVVEGSAADGDTGTGGYAGPQGADTTERFRFLLPVPPGIGVGSTLTSTATIAGETSEFGYNVQIGTGADLTLLKAVAPPGTQPPGTDLVYTTTFANTGGGTAQNVSVSDPVPPDTDFLLGSATADPGSTGLTWGVSYSNDGGGTWSYAPVSGGGGAPAGYDRNVTDVRWTFGGSLSATPPDHQGRVSMTVRIR